LTLYKIEQEKKLAARGDELKKMKREIGELKKLIMEGCTK